MRRGKEYGETPVFCFSCSEHQQPTRRLVSVSYTVLTTLFRFAGIQFSLVAQSCPTLRPHCVAMLYAQKFFSVCPRDDSALQLKPLFIVLWDAVLCCAQYLSHIWVTPQGIAHQVPLSTGFSRQAYWSGLLFPIPGSEKPVSWTS